MEARNCCISIYQKKIGISWGAPQAHICRTHYHSRKLQWDSGNGSRMGVLLLRSSWNFPLGNAEKKTKFAPGIRFEEFFQAGVWMSVAREHRPRGRATMPGWKHQQQGQWLRRSHEQWHVMATFNPITMSYLEWLMFRDLKKSQWLMK